MDNYTATKLTFITKRSIEYPQDRFTTMIYLLNADYLYQCYQELKTGKAGGIDTRTKESYTDKEIRNELETVAERIQQKKYRPKPVRRVYIDKPNKEKRPLGIPTIIDKTVQMGMKKILEAIFEPEFLDCSYGFRPKKGCHKAIKADYRMIQTKPVNWILDVDIKGFFDSVDHWKLMDCIKQKVNDPLFNRLLIRFLKAGAIEEGIRRPTKQGTPQGGVLSPVLANIYLHYVLDLWFEKHEKKCIHGYTELVRYADDFIIGAQTKPEAEQILADIEARLEKFNLELSDEKTKIIEFGRYAQENAKNRGKKKPDTFDFLGFTHYCSTSQKGNFLVKYKTQGKRKQRHLKDMNTWLKAVRNQLKTKDIWKLLSAKLQGHYNYYGISSNSKDIQAYHYWTVRLVFKWLNRRSHKQSFNWKTFTEYLERYPLPKPALAINLYDVW
jgi:RNA-directed DNA polymerase